jgi:alkylated DNA repair dioxygenase AlkB
LKSSLIAIVMHQSVAANPSELPICFYPDFLSLAEADAALEQSLTLAWRQVSIRMLGKTLPVPRLEILFGDAPFSYVYSDSVQHQAEPWPEFLGTLRDRIEGLTDYSFQVALGNLYRNGQDSNGYHADDEPELGESPAIASLSLGAARTFRLKRRGKGQPSMGLELTHGSLLIMLPGCQEAWVHAIPKTKKVNEPRVNWTFRPHVSSLTPDS